MVQALGSISYSIFAEIIFMLSKKFERYFGGCYVVADRAIHVFHFRYNFHKIWRKTVQVLSSWPGSECKTVPLSVLHRISCQQKTFRSYLLLPFGKNWQYIESIFQQVCLKIVQIHKLTSSLINLFLNLEDFLSWLSSFQPYNNVLHKC